MRVTVVTTAEDWEDTDGLGVLHYSGSLALELPLGDDWSDGITTVRVEVIDPEPS